MSDFKTGSTVSDGREASECKNLLAQPWYPLGEPWVHSEGAGTAILSGNYDPHIATPICDTEDLIGDNYDIETARALADHIIDLHNNHLDTIEKCAVMAETMQPGTRFQWVQNSLFGNLTKEIANRIRKLKAC